MKKTTLLLMSVLAIGMTVKAQDVSVNSGAGQDIGSYLESNFVGNGAYIFNVQLNGQSGVIPTVGNHIGTFQSNGYPSLGMESGLVLTTGSISVVPGPNASPGMCSANPSPYVDPIITNYVETYGYPVTGCGTIDFDFVSLSSDFSFSYCFGSEEYPEFVYTEYNDAFVILLTGPDPETGEQFTRNIAIVPNTISDTTPDGIPVSINTVNNGYHNTGLPAPAWAAKPGFYMFSNYYFDNDVDTLSPKHGVQYDGFTLKLSASAQVLPCTKYHMHISVCNVSNNMYDSGVFLESHSFSGPSSNIGLVQMNVDTVYRDTPKDIELTLNGTDFDNGTLYVSFGGEAQYGVDYVCLTNEGNVLNSGETMPLDNTVRTLTVTPLPGADLSYAKRAEIYFGTSLCAEYPEAIVKDTMVFILKESASTPNPNGIDGVEAQQLAVYPNPASDRITVSTASVMKHVAIIDAAGREVYRADIEGSRTSTTIDVSMLEAGIYTVRSITDNGEVARRVVIK